MINCNFGKSRHLEIDGDVDVLLEEWVSVTAVFINSLLENGADKKELKDVMTYNFDYAFKKGIELEKSVKKRTLKRRILTGSGELEQRLL